MGRFHRNIRRLVQTEHPVFALMREMDKPVPVDPRVFYPWAESQPKPGRYKLMALFREFTMSERYSKAVMAEGAHYHDLNGNVTRPMPPTSADSARANLEEIERRRAERLAAA